MIGIAVSMLVVGLAWVFFEAFRAYKQVKSEKGFWYQREEVKDV